MKQKMKQKIMRWINSLALLTFIFNPAGFADDAGLASAVQNLQEQMKQLQRVISQQNEEINQLKKHGAQVQIAPATGEAPKAAPMSEYDFNQMPDSTTGGAQKWLKDLKFSGDLRLRYEAFSYKSGNPSGTNDRNRFRYRLRYGFEKTFNPDMKIGFAMASGESGASGSNGLNTDPASTNTTFDNNFNFKPIYIERAYATYTPSFLAKKGILDKTEISAGKMTHPFEKGSSDMIWDRDVKPEGIYEKADFRLLDSDNFDLGGYVTAGQFVLDEDAIVGGDANLFAYQLGINPAFYTPMFDRPVDVLQAFSFYDYSGYARSNNFLIGGTSLARGNTNADTVSTELDAGKFQVIESYSEVALPFKIPAKLFMDLAGNPSDNADAGVLHENFAYGFGLKLGSIVKKGDWEIAYAYKRIGANAVVGAFNDSDFGDGHAGKRGSVFKLGYAITDSVTLNGAMFLASNLNADTAGILDQEQRRFQVDMVGKF